MIDTSFWTIFIMMVFTLGIASGLLMVAALDLSVTIKRNNPKPVNAKQVKPKKEPGNFNENVGFMAHDASETKNEGRFK